MLEPWVQTIAESLGRAFDAERVIVFGSRASGRASRRSDLDVLIVAQTELPSLARIERALAIAGDSPCAVEPIVYTPEELAQRSASKFVQHVLRTGVLAYER